MLRLIISGGQTGADQAGLRAARALNIPTGGWAPKGFKTEAGPLLELGTIYGLKESRHLNYRVRTRSNVRESDGTVIFVQGVLDGGSELTADLAVAMARPSLILPLDPAGPSVLINMLAPTPAVLTTWLIAQSIQVLNIAGNRESRSPGIGAAVEAFVIEALARWRR